VSIHYQPLAADPAITPEWVQRQAEYGPVRVWDTESWIANSEDRVAGVIASMRAQGQERTAGIYQGNVYDSRNKKVGGQVYPVVQAWPPARGGRGDAEVHRAAPVPRDFVPQRTAMGLRLRWIEIG